jgi:hypothetical protein
MVQTITCDICHKTAYITDVQNGADFDKKYLSCGYIQKIDNRELLDTSVVSQLTSSEPIMCSKCSTAYATDSEYMIHYNEEHKHEEEEEEEEEKAQRLSSSTDHSETIRPASRADVSPNTPRADEELYESRWTTSELSSSSIDSILYDKSRYEALCLWKPSYEIKHIWYYMSEKKEIQEPGLETEKAIDLELDEKPKPTPKVSHPATPISNKDEPSMHDKRKGRRTVK